MQHFDFLSAPERAALFAEPPAAFARDAAPASLAAALGATLYTPGSRTTLPDDALRAAALGATSQVWCLEDAVSHSDLPQAQAQVVAGLKELDGQEQVPLLFVRVRTPQHLTDVVLEAGSATAVLTGFVLPKITPGPVGDDWFRALADARERLGRPLYGLPVLEHADLAWRESRAEHLSGLRALFDRHRDLVLSLRVGGTDLCGLFGLRRDRDTTIWDVAVVRDALCDVINVFARGGDYSVSGPVWEHFAGPDRLFKPQLRATPFAGRMSLRQQLLRDDADELLREVLLDRANGLHGKTVIHPAHVNLVNTLQTVTQEEYDDARTVLDARGQGGAVRSAARNKMNETGPHELWADHLVQRAHAFGVLARPDGVIELLQRGRLVADALYART